MYLVWLVSFEGALVAILPYYDIGTLMPMLMLMLMLIPGVTHFGADGNFLSVCQDILAEICGCSVGVCICIWCNLLICVEAVGVWVCAASLHLLHLLPHLLLLLPHPDPDPQVSPSLLCSRQGVGGH